jgi:hypothetical protein
VSLQLGLPGKNERLPFWQPSPTIILDSEASHRLRLSAE